MIFISPVHLPGMPVTPQPEREPHEKQLWERREHARARSALRTCLDNELEAAVVGDFGGEFVRSHVPLPGVDHPSGALPVRTRHAPDGRRMVIRTYSVGGNLAIVKGQELFAEARMLRAFSPVTEGGLLLLLSIDAVEQTSRRQSAGMPRQIDPYLVNVLEEGGWKVLPWDFAEQRPAFMEYLREWSG
jgi:hypothetical protein